MNSLRGAIAETKAYFADPSICLHVPAKAFDVLHSLGYRLLIFIPVWLIALKMLDRWLEYYGKHPFHWYPLSGFFGKIDDVSYWIVITGLLACRGVMQSWRELPTLLPHEKETVSVGQVRAIFLTSIAIAVLYLVVMYFTDGTFFKPVGKEARPAQVAEGLTNLALIPLFYTYLVVGRITARRAEYLSKFQPPAVDQAVRHRVAKILQNAPWFFVFTLVAAPCLFPIIKWLGALAFERYGYSWLNWTHFAPKPIEKVLMGWAGAVLLTLLYFLPWFDLPRRAKCLLGQEYVFRLNTIVVLPLIALQTGPLAVISVLIKDIWEKRADIIYVWKIERRDKK